MSDINLKGKLKKTRFRQRGRKQVEYGKRNKKKEIITQNTDTVRIT